MTAAPMPINNCAQYPQMLLAESGYSVVIRVLVRARIAESYVIVTGTFYAPRTHHANAAAVQQQSHHHHRVIRCLATPVTPPAK